MSNETTGTIHRAELRTFLEGLGNSFFTVTYLKRTADKVTGKREIARMTCTNAYGKFTVGGTESYDAIAKGLYRVLDTRATKIGYAKVAKGETDKVQPIRSFGLEGVQTIQANKITYTVIDGHPDECFCQECDPCLWLEGK
jgi:hypothetical protein